MVTLVVVLVVRATLARRSAGSDLVAAEVAQWNAAALLGVAMLVGFGLAVVLDRTAWSWLTPYVDPALVLVAAALILPTPVRMLRQAYRELLEGVPDDEVTHPVHEAVARLRADEGLPDPQIRIGTLGRELYVEIDVLVPVDGRWSVSMRTGCGGASWTSCRAPARSCGSAWNCTPTRTGTTEPAADLP